MANLTSLRITDSQSINNLSITSVQRTYLCQMKTILYVNPCKKFISVYFISLLVIINSTCMLKKGSRIVYNNALVSVKFTDYRFEFTQTINLNFTVNSAQTIE